MIMSSYVRPARRLSLSFVALALLAGLTSAATSPAPSTPKESPAVNAWIGQFEEYAAQPQLENDRPYASSDGPKLHFVDLLRALPEPDQWPALRTRLAEVTAAAPAEAANPRRARLQAAGWLAAYLNGDRAAIRAGLPPPPAEGDERAATPAVFALENLRQALAESESAPPLAKQVEGFERTLSEVEPVDLAEVKRRLGGEENFGRLEALLEDNRGYQQQAMVIYAEYEKTKDQSAAETKMAALQKEHQTSQAPILEALGERLNDELVQRYLGTRYLQTEERTYVPVIELPDLVAAVGADRAEALLLRALKLPVKLALDKRTGAATAQLARKLTLANLPALKAPSWSLAADTTAEAAALFEAYARQFPPVKDDYDYKSAAGYYLAGLIQRGQVPEAIAFASQPQVGGEFEFPYEVIGALEKGGQAEPLWNFLHAWLQQHPASHEWDRFTRISTHLGRQAELKALIKSLAENGAFNGLERRRVQQMQADVELATGDFPAALARLRQLLAAPATTREEISDQFSLAEKLMLLANLQGDQAEFTSAQHAAEALLASGWDHADQNLDHAFRLMAALNRFGRFVEAARIGDDALARIPALEEKAKEKKDDQPDFTFSDYTARGLLGEQLRSLVELGRWKQAEALIEDCPWWGTVDAVELLKEETRSDDRPLGYFVGRVAQERGQPARARQVFEAQLAARPGSDPVYASYLGLVKQAARPLLAKLAAADRYEERPLIWLAKLQSDAGEWDPAVTTLQQAIGIDPSDGEEGRGDRMRVYAFMARALAAKGDAVKAKFFEDVVKSIRLSETADQWHEAGAYGRAIELYQQALGFFRDAYCIQSRLAVRLADEGRMDEAAEHYRRAFELMPDSFGRVESHCFGCEHVFVGENSQGLAEKVFAQMLAARPDKPQLHYLLGYLREAQDRTAEAAESYRRAVALDPLYLNAWSRLAGLDQASSTPAQRDDLALKLIELDPTGRHASGAVDRVTDLPRLWRGLKAAEATVAGLPHSESLWPMKASAEQLRKSPGRGSRGFLAFKTRDDAATVLCRHHFVQALQSYVASLNPPPERVGPP
jgi:hypothetical protein